MTNQTEQGAAQSVRQAFEVWARRHGWSVTRMACGNYLQADVRLLWGGYEAGRAAVSTPEGYTSDGWIDVDKGLPEPQTPVLLDVGNKYPLRVMWVEPKTLELGIDQDESAGEYDEETDTYYCHSGWYEWNQHDEVNWRVTAKPLRWMPLPATPGDSHAAP